MGRKGKRGKAAKGSAAGQQIAGENEQYKYTPHSFVFHRGDVGKNIGFLIKDMRQVMSPYSAKELKVHKKNVLKDFVNVAGVLNVSHFVIYTKTISGINMRLSRLPRGPTLNFRVVNYSLCRDVVSSLKRHNMEPKQFLYHPLLIMNGFSGDGMHFKLMTSMFQHMFPSVNVNKVNLNDIRRCVVLNYNSSTETIEFRHYNIRAVPVGMSKGMKKLIKAKIPDMSKFDDISDLLIKGGDLSESEAELDGEHNEVILPQELSSRGNIKASKSAIRLTEIGPRMTLKLIKIQEDLCEGNVLYHSFIKKTEEEIADVRKHKALKKQIKDERKKTQDMNVEQKKKNKEDAKVRSLKGMQFKESQNIDNEENIECDVSKDLYASSDDDAAYFEQETGSKPDKDLFLRGKGMKRKTGDGDKVPPKKKFKTSNLSKKMNNKGHKSDSYKGNKSDSKGKEYEKDQGKNKKMKTALDIMRERKNKKNKKRMKQQSSGQNKGSFKDSKKQEVRKFVNANKKSKTRFGFKRKT